jgi:ribosome maturation factor RimP
LDAFQEDEELEGFEEIGAESANDIEGELAEELEEHLDDDDFWEDDFESEAEPGDGGDGGGIILGDAAWAKSALHLAEDAIAEFNGDLSLFAFKAGKDPSRIHVRLDKLSDKYGSPTMVDLEKFTSSYAKRLADAGEPDISVQVSSPGAERVVRIPQDLERFKDLPMYVRYVETSADGDADSVEKDGILELESVDTEGGSATWKLANVRINRDLAGKGRGMNRKQRDWRAQLPFESLHVVRLYLDL